MSQDVTILCIDDDDQICFALEALFHTQNWNVVTANSVDEGVAAFRAREPQLVLIDYHMPQVNGVEGVQRLRRLSETVPILVFTIEESQEVADAFLAAGASDFALKPIKAPDIISRVKLHLRLLNQPSGQTAAPYVAKGISRGTMELILHDLDQREDYVTANEIAKGSGLAYQTVYRYLQYMVQEKMVEVLNLYGKVGRPRQLYRKL